jgi:glutaredoxin
MEIPIPQATCYTIYSKSGCPNCVKVKTLLKETKAKFTVIDCDEYLLEDKPGFLQFIYLLVGREYKMFPMIFLDGTFIGGLEGYLAKIGEEKKETELDFNTEF